MTMGSVLLGFALTSGLALGHAPAFGDVFICVMNPGTFSYSKSTNVLTKVVSDKLAVSGEPYNEPLAALRYQAQQAEKDNPEALYAMGMRFLNGIDVPMHEATGRG